MAETIERRALPSGSLCWGRVLGPDYVYESCTRWKGHKGACATGFVFDRRVPRPEGEGER